MSLVLPPPAIEIKVTKLAKQQIGSAAMEQDGTIVILQRLVDGGLVGETVERIKPGAPDYEKVRKHLPALRIGHSVAIYNDWDF